MLCLRDNGKRRAAGPGPSPRSGIPPAAIRGEDEARAVGSPSQAVNGRFVEGDSRGFAASDSDGVDVSSREGVTTPESQPRAVRREGDEEVAVGPRGRLSEPALLAVLN